MPGDSEYSMGTEKKENNEGVLGKGGGLKYGQES